MINFTPLKRRRNWYNKGYLLDVTAYQIQQELKLLIINETKRNESVDRRCLKTPRG